MNNKQLALWEKIEKESSLEEIQQYIKSIIEIRGFSKETAEQKLLMLIEEVGELAKAIRKDKAAMGVDKSKLANYDTVESEIADVFIVLVALCNTLEVDLFSSFKDKEKENIKRSWVK